MPDFKTILLETERFRLSKRISLSALARWIGINHNVIRRALTGQTKPHDYHRQAFIEFYRDNVKQK